MPSTSQLSSISWASNAISLPETSSNLINLIGNGNQVEPVALEELIMPDPNLRKFKEELCSSGLSLREISELSVDELAQFLKEYIRITAFSAKKFAERLQLLVIQSNSLS